MHSKREAQPSMGAIAVAAAALVWLQVAMLGYLLYLGLLGAVLMALVVGSPAALASHRLMLRARSRCLRMSVMMLAAGGFGMLAGCIADLGQVGLYGMLALCRGAAPSWFDARQWWAVMTLTPWTYLGMLGGGTAGMAWLDAAHGRRLPILGRVALYGFCDLSMVMGMLLVEHWVALLSTDVAPTMGGVLMVASMLAGMGAGMAASYRLGTGLVWRRGAVN
ncbi:MAG: hypothetical protein P8076_09690 [Gammaproteobacteria bacterium]